MSRLLLPVTPIYGHIVPLLGIGRGLVARGHQVSVLTVASTRLRSRRAG